MLRKCYDRMCRDSYFHRPQPLGVHFTHGLDFGYYNDLTAKADYRGRASANGTPISIAADGTVIDLPVNAFQMALGVHDRWLLQGNARDRERFLQLADRFIVGGQRAAQGMVWLYDFDLPLFGLRRPWISAMAQGQAASVFVRAYRLTGNERYLDVARAAAALLAVEVEQGGVGRATRFGWWLEEYPSTPPSCVLNGAIFALWGLYDLGRVGDAEAARQFEQFSGSIAAALPAFDVRGWSRYDLYPAFVLPNLASPFYHRLHIAQLDAMWRITGNGAFATYRDRWARGDKSSAKTSAAIMYKTVIRAQRLAGRVAVGRAARGAVH